MGTRVGEDTGSGTGASSSGASSASSFSAAGAPATGSFSNAPCGPLEPIPTLRYSEVFHGHNVGTGLALLVDSLSGRRFQAFSGSGFVLGAESEAFRLAPLLAVGSGQVAARVMDSRPDQTHGDGA